MTKKSFIKNLSISFTGGLIAFFLLFVAQIFAARFLGPEEFGKYSLLLAFAQILSLIFVFDSDVAATSFLSRAKNKKERKDIAHSIFPIFFSLLIVGLGIALVFESFFLDLFSLNENMFQWSIFLGVAIALKRIFDAFLRAQSFFSWQAMAKVTEAIGVLLFFLCAFFFFENATFLSYASAVLFGALMLIALSTAKTHTLFGLSHASWKKMTQIFDYAKFGAANTFVTGLVKNTDKILVVSFVGLLQTGVYAIYSTLSVVVAARVVQMFVNVYFPFLAKQSSLREIIQSVQKIFWKTLPLVFGGAVVFMWLALLFVGREYPINWLWIVILAGYVCAHFAAALFGWVSASVSKEGYRDQNRAIVVGVVFYVLILGVSHFVFDHFSLTLLFFAFFFFRTVSAVLHYRDARKLIA